MKEHSIETIAKEVENLKKATEALREAGIDEEVMIAYLHYKTKVPIKQIKKMLEGEKKFFSKLALDNL